MQRKGYTVYSVDYGECGPDDADLGLDFYGKTVHDRYFEIIGKQHPGAVIDVMGYCMGGTLMLPYLARRAEERLSRGGKMDIRKLALMASPVRFDDDESGHGQIRSFIRGNYDPGVMNKLFGSVNIPPQSIDFGMNEIQPGVHYMVLSGFYERAVQPGAIEDSAPFLYWLTHGTKFPAAAHRDWIEKFFLGNELVRGTYRLPSTVPALDGQPWTWKPSGGAASGSSTTGVPGIPSPLRAPAWPAGCGGCTPKGMMEKPAAARTGPSRRTSATSSS
jgi:poly(3-hydroxyalkanoate) synthetase